MLQPFICILSVVLDRNSLMCNNVLELACNPSTIFNVTELTADPTYDVTDKFPDWMKRQIKRQERINKILRWYQDLHWGWKLGVGIALLIGAIGFTVATGGGGAGVISVLVQTAIGVGVGIGLYTAGSLLMGTFTWEGLANAALDAFLITSAMVFISSAVNAIKYACRGKQLRTEELKKQVRELSDVELKSFGERGKNQGYMTDLMWIDKDAFSIFILNYEDFMIEDMSLKKAVMNWFLTDILYWWSEDVEVHCMGGESKEFNIYLVNGYKANSIK